MSVLYQTLIEQGLALKTGHWISDLANFSALLNSHLADLNWVGFYLLEKDRNGKELLFVGPFQGKHACVQIDLGRGVCGTAALEKRTIVVPDVHTFPGHIACDERSRSEIVIPLIQNGKLLGVLDLDSPKLARFSEQDRAGLEEFVRVVVIE